MAEYVYLGRDNPIKRKLFNGRTALTDEQRANIAKVTLHFGSTTVSSADYSDNFDWSDSSLGTGEIEMKLGVPCETEGVSAGSYQAELYVFDSTNTNGVFWGYIPVVVVDLSS